MSKIIAQFTNISKTYKKEVLNIDSFDISKGECLIINGDNGSGKSTLLKIINGLIDSDGGTVSAFGNKSNITKAHILSNYSIYLSPKPYMLDLSVSNNIAYPLIIRRKKYKERVDYILNKFDLTHLANRDANSLSSGEKQRVSLARAYIVNPDIWLLDEPTDNLDENYKEVIYELLNNLLDMNKSIVVTSHLKDIVYKVKNRVFKLESGKLYEQN